MVFTEIFMTTGKYSHRSAFISTLVTSYVSGHVCTGINFVIEDTFNLALLIREKSFQIVCKQLR